jgi:hypothetical protein
MLTIAEVSPQLTNATVWVEGISDRLYLREYLRKYLDGRPGPPPIREDTHYSFLECGGANVAHIDFSDSSPTDELTEKLKVTNVCSHSCLVLDGDNQGKQERVEKLKQALGNGFFMLESKEIEHLLPLEVVNAYVAQSAGKPGTIKLEDYARKKEPLGSILDDRMGLAAPGIFSEGKTIKNKDGLLTFACKFMREKPEWRLTDEARELCEKLVTFICLANGLQLPRPTPPPAER